MPERAKRVLTYGTFDLFHHGHLRLLERLAEIGEEVFVGCSTDEFNAVKGKTAIFPYAERAAILKSIGHVTHVFPERNWAQKRLDIVKYGVDVFAMGDDWAGKFDHLKETVRVVYLPRTEDISTTDIIRKIANGHAMRG